ncbi:putative F-box/FBD/LRR-repeat protein At1g78760 isoform X1 [Trifolium pratense]|uniref:putative F-box/FBD/LRR-repeat protein At1g78760 isoform X1 n=1 Tax=Trifolium pratense TaxID=57577 RepID=UPI001E6925E1|nr:putative F-box/FBD/LRR-repeat protein At1g78760 isoform X1 [Trifolium pratense]XP_045819332.1 putative F-box/FBD/LRR-repeat protein At1g78760 isoform X1 [Trifolium pratense]
MSKSVDEVIMIPPKKRARRDDNEDSLSDLPDCVLLHILSFLNSKHAVQTCILSTRWKHLWKRIPTLILHSSTFSTVKLFATFVTRILTLRDSSTALHALDFQRRGIIETKLLTMILNHVCSHNTHIQRLEIDVTADVCPILSCVSKCRALTSLKLSVCPKSYTKTLFPKSLNLPLLTSLDLAYFTFCGGENDCAEPFSAFTKLNSLVIRGCKVKDAQILSISSETLVDLTMHRFSSKFSQIKLSTPSLFTFTFTGIPVQKICGNGLSSVRQVNIDAPDYATSVEYALVLLTWLQDLVSVESLIVTSTTLQVLSLVPDLFEVKLPSLCNLKSLEVELIPLYSGFLLFYMEEVMLKKAAAKSRKEAAKLRKAFKAGLKPPPVPDGIVGFLLQNSPASKVNITTGCPSSFNLKQVEESVKGVKNINYCSKFAAPASSAVPASAAESASAVAPASAAKMATNVDNSDSMLWPDLVTKAFIDIMVDEVTKGNMPNGVFLTGTWTSMTTRLNSITKRSYKKEQLQEKMHGLRAMFHEFYSLLQNTGFQWNAETNTVTASEEVWQNYLKTHDKASQFQKKGCDHYKLLEIIFNKNNETDVLHYSSIQDQPNSIVNELNNQYLNTESANNARVDNDSSDNDIQVEQIIHSGKQKIQVKDLTSMKESTSHQVGDALVAQAKIVEASSSHLTVDCSLTKCVVALEEIRDISDDIFGKALEKFKDPDWREMFIAMSNDRRRGWLFRL